MGVSRFTGDLGLVGVTFPGPGLVGLESIKQGNRRVTKVYLENSYFYILLHHYIIQNSSLM